MFQIEFIYRLDYVWQCQLVSEKDEANTTRMVNRMLLQNILPLHVGKNESCLMSFEFIVC